MPFVIISLGGSQFAPKEGLDVEFLEHFRALLRELVASNFSFLIVVGGGAVARQYQQALDTLGCTPEDKDWVGIHTTRMNAQFLRLALKDLATDTIIVDPEKDPLPDAAVVIGAGWKPGWSTDYDAAVLAKRRGAKRIVNISNVSHVCSEDPKKNPHAKEYDRMTWTELRTIIGDEWSPGLNAPFDPVAAKLCQEAGIEVSILSGKDLENVRKALRGEKFDGTVVSG